jgi:hypothetical protein
VVSSLPSFLPLGLLLLAILTTSFTIAKVASTTAILYHTRHHLIEVRAMYARTAVLECRKSKPCSIWPFLEYQKQALFNMTVFFFNGFASPFWNTSKTSPAQYDCYYFFFLTEDFVDDVRES